MSELLRITNLSIEYRVEKERIKAVSNMDLVLNKGESLGLVGETGAGKTTTALGIMQLIPDPPGIIAEGQILFKGNDLVKMPENKMQRIRGKEISMIFQDPMTALNPVMTVGEQICEVIRLHEKISREKAFEKARQMMELVGIEGSRHGEYPHEFSGGMKQRIVIAIAIACQPELLIADEPTTALDVTIQAQVLKLIKDLNKRLESSMILITHDLGVVAETCDKVAIMYAGQILEYGTLEQIYENTAHPYTQGLFSSLPSAEEKGTRLKPIPGIMPEPTRLPAGCVFENRCPYAEQRCKEQGIPFREVEPGHQVRCIRRREGDLP